VRWNVCSGQDISQVWAPERLWPNWWAPELCSGAFHPTLTPAYNTALPGVLMSAKASNAAVARATCDTRIV